MICQPLGEIEQVRVAHQPHPQAPVPQRIAVLRRRHRSLKAQSNLSIAGSKERCPGRCQLFSTPVSFPTLVVGLIMVKIAPALRIAKIAILLQPSLAATRRRDRRVQVLGPGVREQSGYSVRRPGDSSVCVHRRQGSLLRESLSALFRKLCTSIECHLNRSVCLVVLPFRANSAVSASPPALAVRSAQRESNEIMLGILDTHCTSLGSVPSDEYPRKELEENKTRLTGW